MSALRNIASPKDLLLQWLNTRPAQSRCEWVIDPDRLIDWSEPKVLDRSGRAWRRVLYSGDDLAFRRACRDVFAQAAEAGDPVLLAVARGSANPDPVAISHIRDVLGMAEGEPLDLSLVAVFKSYFPKVNPPRDTLRDHKDAFLDCLPGLHRAYAEFKNRWGEPDNWNRAQLLSMILLARRPLFRLDDVYCNDPNVADFLTHACRLLTSPILSDHDIPLTQRLIRESMLVKAADVAAWMDLAPTDLAGYLVLRDFAESQGIPNPAAQLPLKFTFRLDPEAMERQAPAVIRQLRRDRDVWDRINRRAAVFFRGNACDKVLDLLPSGTQPLVRAVRDANTSPVLLRDMLVRLLLDFIAGGKPDTLAWVQGMSDHLLLSRENTSEIEAQGAAILGCLIRIERAERFLADPTPQTESLDELLNAYLAGAHLIELDVSEAGQYAEHIADGAVRETVDGYFNVVPNGLKRRVRDRLDEWDRRLAKYINADPKAFYAGSQGAVHMLQETVVAHPPDGKDGRVWILVFDGMRFDSWSRIVQPVLTRHFEVIDDRNQAYLAVLPSRTYEARRSLLAGALPGNWTAPSGKPATDERQLVAKSLGLSDQELDDVCLMPESQTTESRRKLGFKPGDARRFNVLIYPISDDLAHYQNDTLASINARIEREILGDRERYMQGVLDDLLSRVAPEDVVLVTSDHGFIELPADRATAFSDAETRAAGRPLDEAVQYRFLSGYDRDDLTDVVRIRWDDRSDWVLPVGSQWFKREGGRGARYAHGGVSFAEMLVPGCLLRRITETNARIDVKIEPVKIEVPEDHAVTVGVTVANTGNLDLTLEITVSTNLGEQLLSDRRSLATGSKQRFDIDVAGRYGTDGAGAAMPDQTTRVLYVTVRHTDATGQITEPPNGRIQIPVAVVPKAAKIETDALKGFDDI